MDKKKVLAISISFILVIVLISIYFLLDKRYQSGGRSDAKTVHKIPSGFTRLPQGGGDWENGLRYVSWESQISFLTADGNCIYQTSFDNRDFIVKYKNEYYVNEKKLSELVDIAASIFEQHK